MKLASFDIFDTTLVRKCGCPDNIFYILSNRLYPDDSALREEFLLWRKNAERQARKRYPKTDIALTQIYELDDVACFAPYSPKDILLQELQVESENLIINPFVKDLIENKRREGFVICFVSDMYIDSATLSDILRREGCLMDGERVYVSCEHNARKSDGRLFDIVKEDLKPECWEHYGDNYLSDVKNPRKKGIKAYHINTSFTDTERKILSEAFKYRFNYELSILVGYQRMARISLGNIDTIEVAADFVASAYIPYVRFILQKAKERGLKRLYFLSRDGYILMRIAETMQTDFPDIELKYLFVSRKSLLLPYLDNPSAESFLTVQDKGTIKRRNLDSLLKSLRTSKAELADNFSINFDYDKIWGDKEEKDFIDKIFGANSKYLPELKNRIEKERTFLLEYFKQEGLFDDSKSAMVDVGWLGTSRLMINSILDRNGGRNVEFFYYGIRGDVLSSRNGTYLSYFRPEQLSTELTSLVENYFSASPYPSTDKYMENSGKIEPVFVDRGGFKPTELTESNINVALVIANEIAKCGLNFDSAFWCWMKLCINSISELSVNIPLSAFNKAANFDDAPFVRKFRINEFLNFLFLGKNITAYDRCSLKITCGAKLYPLLWRLHNITGRLRRYLYLKMYK